MAATPAPTDQVVNALSGTTDMMLIIGGIGLAIGLGPKLLAAGWWFVVGLVAPKD